jgi:hypothetical protein
MKLLRTFLLISITLTLLSCGTKNDKAAPGDSSISNSSNQKASGGIRGVFVCADINSQYPKLEFRSNDIVEVYNDANGKDGWPLHYTIEGNFIYFTVIPGDNGLAAFFLVNLKIASPTRLEQDLSDEHFVWVKSQ